MVSEILPGQNFKGQGHYGKIKSQIKVTSRHCKPTTPSPCPYQALTSNTLQFPKYSPEKILTRSRSLLVMGIATNLHVQLIIHFTDQ